MQSKKVDVSGAKQWYNDADRRYSPGIGNTTQTFGDMGVFFEALTHLVLPSTAEKRVPSTFLFDEERIMKLKSDMLDAVNLEVCMRMYEDLERVGRFSSRMFGASRAVDEDTLNRSMSPEFNFNSPISTSRPSSLVFSTSGSASSSPRSSFVMPSYVAPETSEPRTRTRDVYSTLVALLQSATPTSRPYARWQELAPAMALQIFRYTNAPSEMLAAFEEKLMDNVCNANTQLYLEVEQSFHSRLMAELGSRVREFKALSGVSLFAVATGGRVQSGGSLQSGRERDMEGSPREGQEEGGLEDMAVRLAHLGVLHWRVWAQLVYLSDADDDMSLDGPSGQI
ncbi:t-complex protein 11 domain-containing protein [Hirsutella rhossiliensis]|uniref:T-complex protein 11 domain-containing protein n=1 Tax=Hirsutella rhossiliensis TaxID=111463 RepID=A0A9P8SNE2_9HYPO|nr:t-complex protein 11 domain-containing protein [Hirsutella rhossiliensis]KAH0967086.1 t-complex protein 11 domain-containing protein [Hirsutella rhossiliensis]